MWARTVSNSWNFIKSHDARQLTIRPGLRGAVGAVLPLFVGVVTGHILPFLAVTLGAQVAGFAGRTGTLRRRTRTMLFAAFWMAVTTFVGGLAGATWWAVLVMTLLGFASGMLNAISVEAGLVGMWSVIAFLFISSTPQTPLEAAYRGLLSMAGSLVQALLMLGVDWRSRSSAESNSVAQAFSAVAVYALSPSRAADLQVARALLQCDDSLSDSYMKPERLQALRVFLDAAESVRIDLVALTSVLRSIASQSSPDDPLLAAAEEGRTHAAAVLKHAAAALATAAPPGQDLDASLHRLNDVTRLLGDRLLGDTEAGDAAQWSAAYKYLFDTCAVLSQVRDDLHSRHSGDAYRLRLRWPTWQVSLRANLFEAVRTNLTFRSAIFRHAIRLAAALCAATVLYRISPLPRGYWLPLTTVVILRPEFSATLTRGVTRVLGTLLGAVFATILLAVIPDPTHMLAVLMVGIFLWAVYALFNYNMVLFACALTAEVVVLLSFFEHVAPADLIADRVAYTVAGSLLAFVAYLVWPTWEHTNIPSVLVKLVEAERAYVRSTLCSPTNADVIRASRKRARVARTNAANRIEQAIVEPTRWRIDADAVNGLLTSLHRLSDDLLTVEYHVAEVRRQGANPTLVQFGEYADRCLEEIELQVRNPDERQEGHPAAHSGALDEVSPITKEELLAADVPPAITSALVRMEENLATMFRMVPLRR